MTSEQRALLAQAHTRLRQAAHIYHETHAKHGPNSAKSRAAETALYHASLAHASAQLFIYSSADALPTE